MFVNIAAYRFAVLSGLPALRTRLMAHCRQAGLKGTILLSTEGVNLFVAGRAEAAESLLTALRQLPGLEDLAAKYSETTHQPFTRMLERIKKEIIAFGVPGIEPARYTSRRLQAQELRRWLDEGRPVTLLDTRNDYEVKLGSFRNALPIGLDHIRNFPEAVARLPEALKQQPHRDFLHGRDPLREGRSLHGVAGLSRCVAAGRRASSSISRNAVGRTMTASASSSTSVWDWIPPCRNRRPRSASIAWHRSAPMKQADPRYVPGKSCPFCFRSPQEQMAEVLAQRMRNCAC